MSKIVSNEEYNAAVNNVDFIKIGRSVTRKFKLDKDLRHECWLYGLWDALKKFSDIKSNKFTTYLYNCVYWRCLKEACRKPQKTYMLPPNIVSPTYQDVFEELPTEYKDIIVDRIVYRLSFKELAAKYQLSYFNFKEKNAVGFKINEKSRIVVYNSLSGLGLYCWIIRQLNSVLEYLRQ